MLEVARTEAADIVRPSLSFLPPQIFFLSPTPAFVAYERIYWHTIHLYTHTIDSANTWLLGWTYGKWEGWGTELRTRESDLSWPFLIWRMINLGTLVIFSFLSRLFLRPLIFTLLSLPV